MERNSGAQAGQAINDSVVKQINGRWRNQLGSYLNLWSDEEGLITGSFNPSVGGVHGTHRVTGYLDPRPRESVALGFVVSWHPAHSITVWLGQYDRDNDVITATWLLTGELPERDGWRSTNIGHDVFHRDD